MLIMNEYLSKLKIRYIRLGDWINVITFLSRKTLKTSIVDEKKDDKEALELKKIHFHYLDKRKAIMKSIHFKVEGVIGDIISKGSISPEQITKPKNFIAKVF